MSGFVPGVYQQIVPPPSSPSLQTGVPVFIGYGQPQPLLTAPRIRWPLAHHGRRTARGVQRVGAAQSSSLPSSSSSSSSSWTQYSTPWVLNDWSQFDAIIGPYHPDSYLRQAVQGFFNCGGVQCQIVLVSPEWAFANNAPVVSAWQDMLKAVVPELVGLDLACMPSLMIDPGMGAPVDGGNAAVLASVWTIQGTLIGLCETRADIFVILDFVPVPSRLMDPITTFVNQTQQKALDQTNPSSIVGAAMGYVVAQPGMDPVEAIERTGAVYFPWVRLPNDDNYYPPSGHVAGVYAASDAATGVNKAPANAELSGTVDVQFVLSDQQQAQIDLTVNCLRVFPNSGVMVWGARTLASDDALASNWIYISVRRLFITIGRWLVISTQWAVFEPNNLTLWLRLNRQLFTYLSGLFYNGLLKGAGPADAFYIKCDAENNPTSQANSGQLNVEVGLVPATPGELIVIHLTQSATGATVAVGG